MNNRASEASVMGSYAFDIGIERMAELYQQEKSAVEERNRTPCNNKSMKKKSGKRKGY